MMSSGRVQVFQVAGMTLSVALATGVIAALRVVVPEANLSVLYLLPVMFCAVTWGWWVALVAALAAFLTYDFAFVEPLFTFTIRDPEEWASLVGFLVVAAVTSNLAARERARREEANRQARTAIMLYEIGRALGGNDLERGLREVAERLVRDFRLGGVVVATTEPGGRLVPRAAVGACDAALLAGPAGRVFMPSGQPGRTGRWVVGSGRRGQPSASSEGARDSVANFPLRREEHNFGMLRLVGRRDSFADDETRLLVTIADRVAVALDREKLQHEANRAEVLRRTDELRTALLNSVSHDLRTPLAAIKASAESLLQKDVAWTDEDRDGFAAAIDRESDRLNRLVANLLDMSRIEGGALRPHSDWYDLGELVREVVARLRPGLGERPIELTIQEVLEPVSLDYLMIDQVLTNLIENAAKYTPPASPIMVDVRATEASVRVAVQDCGPGIPADKRDRIFDKFYRLDTERQVRGSGLGLAVSRGLVEGHGGTLWVADGDGPPEARGACFIFELPRHPLPDLQAGHADERGRDATTADAHARVTFAGQR